MKIQMYCISKSEKNRLNVKTVNISTDKKKKNDSEKQKKGND